MREPLLILAARKLEPVGQHWHVPLPTIAGADRIYVVAGGRVVESGTYRELLAQGGLFARLAARQIA